MEQYISGNQIPVILADGDLVRRLSQCVEDIKRQENYSQRVPYTDKPTNPTNKRTTR